MRLMNPRNKLVTIAPEINSLITPEAKREAPGLRETWASEESLSPDPSKAVVESPLCRMRLTGSSLFYEQRLCDTCACAYLSPLKAVTPNQEHMPPSTPRKELLVFIGGCFDNQAWKWVGRKLSNRGQGCC